jgi:hypothetical protein
VPVVLHFAAHLRRQVVVSDATLVQRMKTFGNTAGSPAGRAMSCSLQGAAGGGYSFEFRPEVRAEVSADSNGTALWSREEPPFYRYALTRRWTGLFEGVRTLLVCGLNPSDAGAQDNDQTITKEIGFASRLGCCRLVKVNLYGLISTDPAELEKAADPIGRYNDHALDWYARWSRREKEPVIAVAAWGAHPMATPERITFSPEKDKFGRETVDAIRIVGSPDLTEPVTVEIKLPRKKPKKRTLTPTETKKQSATAPVAPPDDDPGTHPDDREPGVD